MQTRTIEDIYSKEYGHVKFARFIDIAKSRGYTISNIKEGYEKYKFLMDDVRVEFDKSVKDVRSYYDFIEKTVEMNKLLRGKIK